MPTQDNQMNCICCGRPSTTVVCMRCFFNYDHRTANNRELEKPIQSQEETIFTENERYISFWEQEPDPEPIQSSDVPPIKERKKTNGNDTPTISWFSRLPRFS